MSFTERNPVVIGLITVIVIAVVTVGALSIQGSTLRGGYELTASFVDAAGLREGDDVFVAGVRAGTVQQVDIVNDHVEVVMTVNGHELPGETRAEIVVRTLTGTRGIVLRPEGSFDELLADGDVIPAERTNVPIDVPEFGDVSEELLSDTDSEALNELLGSLTDVTRGQREEIAELIEGGTRVTTVVNEQEENIRTLLDSLAQVSEVLNSRSDDIVTLIDEFGSTLSTLRARREELQRFFRQTNATARTSADLVARERAELDRILSDVHVTTDVLSRHQMELAEALAYAGDAITGFASITYTGQAEVPWGHVFVQSAGPVGIDILAGCGGLIDKQLDDILGPDPRSCEEQENETFPDDTQEQAPNPRGAQSSDQDTSGSGGALPVPPEIEPQPLDAIARRALIGGAR
jgi:phospholipid/cholesterol/gamma-HCH transport system substrate-binding protein